MPSSSVQTVRSLSSDQLAGITSIDDVMSLWGGEIAEAAELGDGFAEVTNKDALINKPFIIANFRFSQSDDYEGRTFAVVHLVTRDGEKLRLTDGSTGICRQLMQWYDKNPRTGGIICRWGLTKSEYTYEDEQGKKIPATTYYVATSNPN